MALIDSGADESFIDSRVCQQLGIETELLDVPLDTKALNGILLARVDRRTIPIPLLLSGNHQEKIRFHVIDCPHVPLLLGFPWLKLHNPHFDWTTGKIRSWSLHCHSHCLRSAQTPTTEQPPVAGVKRKSTPLQPALLHHPVPPSGTLHLRGRGALRGLRNLKRVPPDAPALRTTEVLAAASPPISAGPVPAAPVPAALVPVAPVSAAPGPTVPVPAAPVPAAPVPEAPVPEAPVPAGPAPLVPVPHRSRPPESEPERPPSCPPRFGA